MNIFPAIDLYEGAAVRLFKGDYDQMTVYASDPAEIARSFAAQGSAYLHVVDLDGAKDGSLHNFSAVAETLKIGRTSLYRALHALEEKNLIKLKKSYEE